VIQSEARASKKSLSLIITDVVVCIEMEGRRKGLHAAYGEDPRNASTEYSDWLVHYLINNLI
jgi:hypothetical protein